MFDNNGNVESMWNKSLKQLNLIQYPLNKHFSTLSAILNDLFNTLAKPFKLALIIYHDRSSKAYVRELDPTQ